MGFGNLDPTPPYMKKSLVSRMVEALLAFYFSVGMLTFLLWVIHTVIRVFSLGGDWFDKVIFVVKGIIVGIFYVIGWAYVLYSDAEQFWWIGFVALLSFVTWLHTVTQNTVFEKFFEALFSIMLILAFMFVVVYFKEI